MSQPISIKLGAPVTSEISSQCGNAEPFALMVLGDSMEPEFHEGEIIVVEPEGLVQAGSFVIARHEDEWIFRQIIRHDGGWLLCPLNATYATKPLPDLASIRGVVIQKCLPGRRSASKWYVEH